MTEEEAKTRWCPFVRLTADGPGEWHTNRDPSLPSSPGDTQAYRCIASACMAWRTRQRSVLRTEPWPEKDTTAAPSVPAGRYGADVVTEGYCGLAGAPS